MLLINLRLAFRNLLRNKVYSFLIIGGFAIGFVACILIAFFYREETTVNQDFADHSRIYRIYDVKMKRFNLNWDLYPIIASEYAAVENACPLDYFQNIEKMSVSDERTGKTVLLKYLAASTNDFFSVFSVKLKESVSGKPFNQRESIAISHNLAVSLFGDRNPLGEKINVGNYFIGNVSSVFDEFPANSSFRADVIINSENENFRLSNTTVNGKHYNPTNHFVKLKEATSPYDFINELNRSAALEALDIDSMALQRLDNIYLSELKLKSSHSKGNPTLLKILVAVALLILFLSSINYLNYSVSMQYSKLREVGIKKSFGAKKLPFVENTAVSAGSPGMINHKYGMESEESSFDMNCIYVGDNYLKTMEIELLDGHDFLTGDLNKSCLVNQQALKSLGWNSFQGKKLHIVQPEGYDVVGVIKDFKFKSFHEVIEPLAIIMTGAGDGNVLSVRLRPGSTLQQIDQIEQSWKTFSPNEPLSFVFYDDFFQAMYIKEKRLTSTITFFSLIAIVLTCMGLLGQVFMICMTRMKEIGIRRINGASVSSMLLLLNKDILMMALISFAVSLPVSLFIMQKWLQGFAYRTNLNWWVFALAGIISLLIALITVSWQSWRAATKNPVEALRHE